MEILEFINRVVDEGIAAAKEDYSAPKDEDKLNGALEGFELCRNKVPHEIEVLLMQARETTRQAHMRGADNYWKIRCREAEIEWVANCVSAVLHNQGLPTIISPTVRGYLKAASIVGVREGSF